MKKIFFGIITTVLLSTAVVYAVTDKKSAKKNAAKKECKATCVKANCDKSKCNKTTCAKMPGCH